MICDVLSQFPVAEEVMELSMSWIVITHRHVRCLCVSMWLI